MASFLVSSMGPYVPASKSSWFDRTVEWAIKDSVIYQLGVSNMQGWGKVLQKAAQALNCHLIYRFVSSIPKIHKSRNQMVKMGMALYTITPTSLLEKFMPPVPMTLCSVGVGVLVPKTGILLLETQYCSFKLEVKYTAQLR